MMKHILPTVAGCAVVALAGTLAVTAPTAFAASAEPEVTQEALSVSEDGLKVPGARDSGEATGQTTNQSASSNLPNIFKSQTALASAQIPATVSAPAAGSTVSPAAATVTPASTGLTSPEESETPTEESEAPAEKSEAPAEDAKDSEDISGSVRQKTEDGKNIALISDVLDVPSNNPSLVGFTFKEASSTIRIEVRTKDDSGWGAWSALDEDEQDESTNKGSEPFTVVNATGVQMRILGDQAPSDAELVLVDPKRSSKDATAVAENAPVEVEPQSAEDSAATQTPTDSTPADSASTTAEQVNAASVSAGTEATVTNQNYVPGTSTVQNVAKSKEAPKPKIASRSSWGAKPYKGSPDYASSIKQAVVHHTSGSNSYSAEDVPSIIRGIQSYHQKGRGWSDIGYNVVADKYGRLWQARDGDLNKAVVGAHVSGYNTGTFGISVLGTYNKAAPPKKTRDAVASAIAWKLSKDGVKPSKSSIVGHRDLGSTDCPGDAFYAKLGEVRDTASSIIDSGKLPDDGGDSDTPPKPKTAIETYAAEKKLGKATGKEFDVKGVDGAKGQSYEKGVVYWSKETGAYHLSGAIKTAYTGDLVTQLGLPTGNEKGGLKDGGAYQQFSKGSIHWSSATGAFPTTGVLQDYWRDKGSENGHLGYPKSAPVYKDGRGEQLFQGARLVWAEDFGTTEFSPKGTISGSVIDNNEPAAPPGDDATDGGSAADSGEGTADDNSKDSDKDGSKDDSKDSSKDSTEPKPKPEPKPEPKPSKEEEIEAKRDAIVKEAKSYLGVKYVWGGTSPTKGWDCSGFTQYVYGKHGIDLPRTTSEQRKAGKEVSVKDAKPGDMIWIPGHIGIISETKGQMYDAGSTRTDTAKRDYGWMLSRGAKIIRVID